MPRSVTVRHGFFPMWEGQGPSNKKNNIPALDEVLGEHDVTESDLMDIIGQTFFLSVYSENILSTAPVQHPSQKTSYTEFPAPPPLRISTWISIIVALVSKCGRLSLRKCHKSKATQEIANLAGRLQKVRK